MKENQMMRNRCQPGRPWGGAGEWRGRGRGALGREVGKWLRREQQGWTSFLQTVWGGCSPTMRATVMQMTSLHPHHKAGGAVIVPFYRGEDRGPREVERRAGILEQGGVRAQRKRSLAAQLLRNGLGGLFDPQG